MSCLWAAQMPEVEPTIRVRKSVQGETSCACIFTKMRENGTVLNFLCCDGCFRDSSSKVLLTIHYGASDLAHGTGQRYSTYDIVITYGDFAGLNSLGRRSPSEIVLFLVLCRSRSKIEVDGFTFSQCFKAPWRCKVHGQSLTHRRTFAHNKCSTSLYYRLTKRTFFQGGDARWSNIMTIGNSVNCSSAQTGNKAIGEA
jgi:hypothetical protein